MSAMKLFKANAKHILVPQAVSIAVLTAVIGIGVKARLTLFTSAAGYFEMILYIALFFITQVILKTTFSLSLCCNVPRKKAFAAEALTVVCSALIMLPALAADGWIYKYYLESMDLVSFDEVGYMASSYVGAIVSAGSGNVEWLMWEFLGMIICGFIALTFFTIMSRLERIGKIVNIGVLMALIAAVVSAQQNELIAKLSEAAEPLLSSFRYSGMIMFAMAAAVFAAAAFLAFVRKPVRNTKGA